MNVEQLVREYRDRIFERNPVLATSMGLPEHAGHWPDVSSRGVEGDISLIEDMLRRARSLEHSPDQELMIWYLEMNLIELRDLQYWRGAPSASSTIIGGLSSLLQQVHLGEEVRYSSLVQRAQSAGSVIQGTMERVTAPVRLWVEAELRSVSSLEGFITGLEVPGQFADDMEQAKTELVAEVQKYRQWLSDVLPLSSEHLPIHPEVYQRLIEERRLGLSVDELRQLGERYLQETARELEDLVTKLGGGTVAEVRTMIRSRHPPTFEDALERYRTLAVKAREFIVRNDLLTVPSEKLEVMYSEPYMRQFLSIAAAGMPSPHDPEQVGRFYLTPHDDERMLEEHSFAFQPLLISHESYPGHHLHGACMNTHPSSVRSSLIASPSANSGVMYSCKLGEIIEGWGLYCEQMMFDAGFGSSDERTRLEQQFLLVNARRWRATRVLLDTGLHTGLMGYDEAVRFLIEQTGYNETTARSEVLMYSRSPGYFLSYLLGTHLLSRLKAEVKLGDKEFHDRILYAGRVPYWFLKRYVFGL